MKKTQEILGMFPESMWNLWRNVAGQAGILQEIRLRAGKPVFLRMDGRERCLSEQGDITEGLRGAKILQPRELQEILLHLCHYSLYAYEDELRRGFFTLPGGHRAGAAGAVVLSEDGKVRSIKHVTYLNIRISHEIKGAADPVLPFLYEKGSVINTLIISPPGCGKTTLLRDMVRQVSEGCRYGAGVNVTVVDERSEIGGNYMGVAQNDVGLRTDILDGCPKAQGMMMAVRSLSPAVVAVDEIGGPEDVQALEHILGCGSRIIATIHGACMEDVAEKRWMRSILDEKQFRRFVVMARREGKCVPAGIYDQDGKLCTG